MTAFADLELACIANVLGRLGPEDCGRAACVASLWRAAVADDALWRRHLLSDFATSECAGPAESPAASYKAAYGAWRSEYSDVSGPLLARTLAAWHKVRAFLAARCPRILETLAPGATAEEVAEAEGVLGHGLPLAMRCIYRVHNGQRLELSQQSCEEGPPRDLLSGLFGCLVFYEHVTSNQLLPLADVAKLSKMLRTVRPLGAQHPLLASREVVYAASFKVADKLCVVDCDTGAVAFKMPHRDWPLTPPQDTFPGACDGLLRWFEEYARRLASGWYGTCESEASLANAGLDPKQAISLFPRAHPLAATAISRGVKVSWSSVMVPQESRSGRLTFAYRVSFSLLTEPQEADTRAQLAAEEAAWQQLQQEQQQERQEQQTAAGCGDAVMTDADSAPAGPAPPAAADVLEEAGGPEPPPPVQRLRGLQGGGGPAPPRQALVLGPCSAAAGPAAVPANLAVPIAWAAAAGGDGGTAAAAPAPAARASEPGGGASSSGGGAPTGGAAHSPAALCQLESRHWAILDASGSVTERVDGEGVVGLYPLLTPGRDSVAYTSCTAFPVPQLPPTTAEASGGAGSSPGSGSSSGGGGATGTAAVAAAFAQQQAAQAAQAGAQRWASGPGRLAGCVLGLMEGSFSFVEGSLMQRTGGAISATCPRLLFAVPEFIF